MDRNLQARRLPPAAPTTQEMRQDSEPDSPIRAAYDNNQLAAMMHQVFSRLDLLQNQMQIQRNAHEGTLEQHSQALQTVAQTTERVQQVITSLAHRISTPQQPNVPEPPAAAENANPSVPTPVDITAPSGPAQDNGISQSHQQTNAFVDQPYQVPPSAGSNNLVKIDLPDAFTGTSKQDVEQWIFNMELYFATETRIPDARKAQHALLNLKDAASKWFRAQATLHKVDIPSLTWPGLCSALRQQFGQTDREFTARNNLSLVHHKNNVAGYISAFNEALFACQHVSESEALWWFQHNLQEPHQKYVFGLAPATLHHAQQLATRFEASNKLASSSRGHSNSSQQATGQGFSNGKNKGKQRANFRPQPRHNGAYGSTSNKGNGNSRGNNGHTSKTMFSCTYCGKVGHRQQECRARLAAQAQNQPPRNQANLMTSASAPPKPPAQNSGN